jgi:hypothetical protein
MYCNIVQPLILFKTELTIADDQLLTTAMVSSFQALLSFSTTATPLAERLHPALAVVAWTQAVWQ